MSRRNTIRKFQVLNSADTTSAQSSEETDVSSVDLVTYQVQVDPTVNATLSVYFSNDQVFDSASAKAINFGQSTPLSGASDTSYLIHIENQGFKWLQIRTANNGGAGTVSAWVSGSVKGA